MRGWVTSAGCPPTKILATPGADILLLLPICPARMPGRGSVPSCSVFSCLRSLLPPNRACVYVMPHVIHPPHSLSSFREVVGGSRRQYNTCSSVVMKATTNIAQDKRPRQSKIYWLDMVSICYNFTGWII